MITGLGRHLPLKEVNKRKKRPLVNDEFNSPFQLSTKLSSRLMTVPQSMVMSTQQIPPPQEPPVGGTTRQSAYPRSAEELAISAGNAPLMAVTRVLTLGSTTGGPPAIRVISLTAIEEA